MRALTFSLRRLRSFVLRCRDALWFKRRLRYSLAEAWAKAGEWAR
jgi:hypothetical protein